MPEIKKKKTKNHKFPKANSYPLNKPIVFCPKDKVMDLYRQKFPEDKDATSLTARIAKWFGTESVDHGWSGAVLAPSAGTRHHVGCLLFQQASKTVLLLFLKENRKEVGIQSIQ